MTEFAFNNNCIITHIMLNILPKDLLNFILVSKKINYVSKQDHPFREWYKKKYFSKFLKNDISKSTIGNYIVYKEIEKQYNYILFRKDINSTSPLAIYSNRDLQLTISISKSNRLHFGKYISDYSYSRDPNLTLQELHKKFCKEIGKEWWFDKNGKDACEDFVKTLISHMLWKDKPWL